MLVYVHNPSSHEVQAGGGGQPGLQNKFKASLNCIVRFCLKKK
jgi:hypothetical protein